MIRLLVVVAFVLTPQAADACVALQEANKLLGWSEDGTLALHARFESDGSLSHAEIQPTRYEGWKYLIVPKSNEILIKKVAVSSCDVTLDANVQRSAGPLTEKTLLELPIVSAMKLVALPSGDGGASKLRAKFTPRKRYAEHQLEIRDAGKKVVTVLPVPVWCVGSCQRDEAWQRWGATVTTVADAGNRKLYVVRMKRVCNGGNDKDMWIDRVIAIAGNEARPPTNRCRGAG